MMNVFLAIVSLTVCAVTEVRGAENNTWSEWTSCEKVFCTGGVKTRTCVNPTPEQGGCKPGTQEAQCTNKGCPGGLVMQTIGWCENALNQTQCEDTAGAFGQTYRASLGCSRCATHCYYDSEEDKILYSHSSNWDRFAMCTPVMPCICFPGQNYTFKAGGVCQHPLGEKECKDAVFQIKERYYLASPRYDNYKVITDDERPSNCIIRASGATSGVDDGQIIFNNQTNTGVQCSRKNICICGKGGKVEEGKEIEETGMAAGMIALVVILVLLAVILVVFILMFVVCNKGPCYILVDSCCGKKSEQNQKIDGYTATYGASANGKVDDDE